MAKRGGAVVEEVPLTFVKRTATARLKSCSAYSQSKYYQDLIDRLEGETHSQYEARTWQERCHYNASGNVYIPAMAFKNCIAEAAQHLSMKIPGKRNATYTKHFAAGIIVDADLELPVRREDLVESWQFVPSDGKRGGGSRVMKCFPVIEEWEGDVVFYVFDPVIDKKTFEDHLRVAGMLIGIGRFRPRNNGIYGRFNVAGVEWS